MSNPPLKAAIIPVTPLHQNCTLIWCTETMKGALSDPGGDLDRLKAAVAQHGVTLEKIILTHGHLDHCGQAGMLAKELGIPIEGPHEEDRFWIAQLGDDGQKYGMHAETFEPDRWLEDGDRVTVGNLTLDVYHCPGHTPGHVVFHHAPSQLAIVGDVLFQGIVAAGRRNSLRPRPWPDVNIRARTQNQQLCVGLSAELNETGTGGSVRDQGSNRPAHR
jgi:hydroxyacylglutathione hydrolase